MKVLSKQEAQEIKTAFEEKAFDNFIKQVEQKGAKEWEHGTFEVVISTNQTDRHGDIVDQRGLRTENYMNQAVVLSNHAWHGEAVGITDSLETRKKGDLEFTVAKGRFPDTEKGQVQRKLYELGLTGTSIGFYTLKRDMENDIILEAELLEWSFVNIPANPNAVSRLLDEKELALAKTMGLTMKEASIEGDVITLDAISETPEGETEEVVEEEDETPEEAETPTESEEETEEEAPEETPEASEEEETPEEVVEEEEKEVVEETEDDAETSEEDTAEETEVEKAISNLYGVVEKMQAKIAKNEEDEAEKTPEEKYLEFKRALQSVAGDLSKGLAEAKKTRV